MRLRETIMIKEEIYFLDIYKLLILLMALIAPILLIQLVNKAADFS